MEIINPWLLYLVLQADSIRSFIDSLGKFITLAGVMAWMAYIIALIICMADSYDQMYTTLVGIWKRMAVLPVLAIMFLMAAAAIPSTKSAAMLLVIPTLANSEVVQQEARELYDLAKLGLKELVVQEAEQPVPPEVRAMRDATGMK